jgi:hypothetical protein
VTRESLCETGRNDPDSERIFDVFVSFIFSAFCSCAIARRFVGAQNSRFWRNGVICNFVEGPIISLLVGVVGLFVSEESEL